MQQETRNDYICFLLQILDFINIEDWLINIVPDMTTMNASFIEEINSLKRCFMSAYDMTFANDITFLPVEPIEWS